LNAFDIDEDESGKRVALVIRTKKDEKRLEYLTCEDMLKFFLCCIFFRLPLFLRFPACCLLVAFARVCAPSSLSLSFFLRTHSFLFFARTFRNVRCDAFLYCLVLLMRIHSKLSELLSTLLFVDESLYTNEEFCCFTTYCENALPSA